jgi:transposase
MTKAIKIAVKESKDDLLQLKRKHPVHLRKRIEMLIICKRAEEALSKLELAGKVKVNPNSIQKWRRMYLDGGIDLLLTFNRKGYKTGMINEQIHAEIEKKLTNPNEPFRSYIELQQWIDRTFIPGINYHTVNKYVKRHFGASLKVARKSHINKDEQAIEDFKKNFPSN